jgi:WD40 repeat protein
VEDIGSSVTPLKGHDSAVYCAVFAGAGSTRVLSCGRGGDVLLHDLNRPKAPLVAKRFVHAGVAHSVAAHVSSPDVFYSAGQDGHVRTGDFRMPADRYKSFWSLPSTCANYQFIRSAEGIENAHSHEAVYEVTHVNEHTLITGGADFKMKTWDLRKPSGADCASCAREFLGHLSAVRGITVDGSRIISACDDGSLRLWPLTRPPHVPGTKKQQHIEAVCVLDGHKSRVAGSACNGNYVATAGWDQTVRIFDLSSVA